MKSIFKLISTLLLVTMHTASGMKAPVATITNKLQLHQDIPSDLPPEQRIAALRHTITTQQAELDSLKESHKRTLFEFEQKELSNYHALCGTIALLQAPYYTTRHLTSIFSQPNDITDNTFTLGKLLSTLSDLMLNNGALTAMNSFWQPKNNPESK